MSDLKPCPFCGKYPQTVVDDATEEKFGVKCFNCGGMIDAEKDTLQEAIEAWNRRALEDQKMIILNPDLTDEQVRELFKKYMEMQPTVVGAHITDVDLMELRDRFGKEVADVVADMISGEEKRWKNEQTK